MSEIDSARHLYIETKSKMLKKRDITSVFSLDYTIIVFRCNICKKMCYLALEN